MIVKKFPILLSVNFAKLRYAYGICSKVPNSDGKHYLFFDCDQPSIDLKYFDQFCAPVVSYQSRSGKGWHVIVFLPCSFSEAVHKVLDCPYVDRSYVSFAVKRGYFFLETVIPLFMRELSYMRIERDA